MKCARQSDALPRVNRIGVCDCIQWTEKAPSEDRKATSSAPFSTFGADFGGFSKPDISAPFGMRCATGTKYPPAAGRPRSGCPSRGGVPPVALRVEKWNGGRVEWWKSGKVRHNSTTPPLPTRGVGRGVPFRVRPPPHQTVRAVFPHTASRVKLSLPIPLSSQHQKPHP